MQDLIAIGYAGMAASSQLAVEKTDVLRKRFRSDIVKEMARSETLPETLYVKGDAEESVRVRGGFLDTVYSICKKRKCGCEIELRKIPVRQTTVEICELYRLNPYRMETDGYILICNNGPEREAELREQGLPARHIGHLIKGLAKMIVDKTEIEYINKN